MNYIDVILAGEDSKQPCVGVVKLKLDKSKMDEAHGFRVNEDTWHNRQNTVKSH